MLPVRPGTLMARFLGRARSDVTMSWRCRNAKAAAPVGGVDLAALHGAGGGRTV